MEKAFYARIYGIVQGVFFRATTKEVASRLGIKGYVRNLNDGSVEVFAQGSEEDLMKLLGFLKKGPKLAKVEKIEVKWLEPSNEFKEFEIRY